MVEIINLRKVRKAKDRAGQADTAAENRARHGRTLAERERDRAAAEQARRALDNAKTGPA